MDIREHIKNPSYNLRVIANDVSPRRRVAHARALLASVDDVIDSRLHGVLESELAERLHDLGVTRGVFVGQQRSQVLVIQVFEPWG